MARKLRKTVLALIGETDKQIIGDDVSGTRRAFTKRAVASYIVNRKAESVTVTHLPGQVFKVPCGNDDKSPSSIKRKVVQRVCLSCRGKFRTETENRICEPCKGSWRWRNGAPEYGFAK